METIDVEHVNDKKFGKPRLKDPGLVGHLRLNEMAHNRSAHLDHSEG